MTDEMLQPVQKITSGTGLTVVTYEPTDGFRKVALNSLEAKGDLRVIEATYASLNIMFNQKEADEIRQKYLAKKTRILEITNHAYYDYTTVDRFDEVCMDTRYIDPKIYRIDVETLIYNDVVAYYTYTGNDRFAFEILSERYAREQRQFFDSLWEKCDRPVMGPHGRSSLF